jgi:cell wall-associated NlpC family hydrolase
VQIESGRQIAQRADELVGCPFKLHGRNPDVGIDCVGVVAAALAKHCGTLVIPHDYAMRGDYMERISSIFDRDCFGSIVGGTVQSGDVILCRPACGQLHFAVIATGGAVHAHAGLRRVVLTPLPLPWPVVGHWRYIGD